MREIKQLRKRVDEVDEQILRSLSERAEICRSIGSGLPQRKRRVRTHQGKSRRVESGPVSCGSDLPSDS
jgi:chorismate mutase